jgi:hypothetical protein
MAMALKDFFHLLPDASRRKLPDADLKKLAKGFAKTKGREPENNGIEKQVGLEMIKAAADDAERRNKKKK